MIASRLFTCDNLRMMAASHLHTCVRLLIRCSGAARQPHQSPERIAGSNKQSVIELLWILGPYYHCKCLMFEIGWINPLLKVFIKAKSTDCLIETPNNTRSNWIVFTPKIIIVHILQQAHCTFWEVLDLVQWTFWRVRVLNLAPSKIYKKWLFCIVQLIASALVAK